MTKYEAYITLNSEKEHFLNLLPNYANVTVYRLILEVGKLLIKSQEGKYMILYSVCDNDLTFSFI